MPNTHSHHLSQVLEMLQTALQGSRLDLLREGKQEGERGATQGLWIETALQKDTQPVEGHSPGRWGGSLPEMAEAHEDDFGSAGSMLFLDPAFPCGEPTPHYGPRKLPPR